MYPGSLESGVPVADFFDDGGSDRILNQPPKLAQIPPATTGLRSTAGWRGVAIHTRRRIRVDRFVSCICRIFVVQNKVAEDVAMDTAIKSGLGLGFDVAGGGRERKLRYP
jgi:hypothetical protein